MTDRPGPRRTAARRLLALVGALVLAAVPLAAAPAAAQTPTPQATGGAAPTAVPQVVPVPSVFRPGDKVELRGQGFPPSLPVQAVLCGNYALNGTGDCDPAAGATTRVGANGTFVTSLRATHPPQPCPCVVLVTSPEQSARVVQPVTLLGHPTGTPSVTVEKRQVEAQVRLTGRTPVSAWFGGSARREAVLQVRNTGDVPLNDPQVTVTFGKGQDPTDLVQVPPIGEIPVGQVAEVRFPVTADAPAFGEYRVKATFGDVDERVTVSTTMSTYPWGLVVVGWLLLQIPLLGLYKKRPVLVEGPPEDPLGARPLAPPPGYSPVFGVRDLRAYLEPGATPPPVVPPQVVLARPPARPETADPASRNGSRRGASVG